MCGIAGIVGPRPDEGALRRMAAALRHRGPDGHGIATGPGYGLVATRLAIVDPDHGWQPMCGDSGALLVYNGEVYDHPELRAELGGAFATTCDTEVVLRMLERHGPAALSRLNGQFALAFWEPGPRRLTLARDRFGVRPLHYAELPGGGIAFASEAKALFASGLVAAAPDLEGIDDVFSLWAPHAPRTAFAGVRQLAPGTLVVHEDGRLGEPRRWSMPASGDAGASLGALLRDSVALRLRADVPVGTYLSGGLDSSLVTALAAEARGGELRTFSVAFTDAPFDERAQQERVARAIGTRHTVVEVSGDDVAAAFPEAVRASETPLVRTAPAPLWLLARAVRDEGVKVVLTGEAADELFWGYDLFKEVALRELHARDPERAARLVDGLYPELGAVGRRGAAWRRALLAGDPADPFASHRPRAAATGAVRALYRPEVAAAVACADPLARAAGPPPAGTPLDRAARLELDTLLGDHLLAAQGDRVALAHGVEGRYPFLDHRVAAHAAALPPDRKLDAALRGKAALRDLAAEVLPADVAERPKRPYAAPVVSAFFAHEPPAWVTERLSPAALDAVGIFDPAQVATLERRCRAGRATGMREGLALAGVLSTQLWHEQLVAPRVYPEETAEPRVRLREALEPAA